MGRPQVLSWTGLPWAGGEGLSWAGGEGLSWAGGEGRVRGSCLGTNRAGPGRALTEMSWAGSWQGQGQGEPNIAYQSKLS
jgi:hypothetical protein